MDNSLQQGIMAAKAGDKSRAFDLLTRATEDPASSEQAWLWLSSVVNDDPERLFCLNNVLKINPDHAAASRGAAMLRQKGVFPCIPAYPETPKVAPAQGSTLRQPLSSKSSQANFTAPAQAQTASTSWNKQELLGFYQYAAMELANKKSCQAVEKSLVSRGASPEIAKKVANEAQSAIKKLRREKYKKRMVRGFLWTIVGVIITCGTYAFADNLGGKFVLLYGAIIFGIIDLVAGLIGWVVNM